MLLSVYFLQFIFTVDYDYDFYGYTDYRGGYSGENYYEDFYRTFDGDYYLDYPPNSVGGGGTCAVVASATAAAAAANLGGGSGGSTSGGSSGQPQSRAAQRNHLVGVAYCFGFYLQFYDIYSFKFRYVPFVLNCFFFWSEN